MQLNLPRPHFRIFIAGILLSAAFIGTTAESLRLVDANNRLAEGWSWKRENPGGWRIRDGALEIRVEPGNMWGPQNDARNVLVRRVPEPATQQVTVSITVSNRPTEQYEQVDLVWYYDDSHMVKIGQELVDGKLSIVMGREERDRTRTLAIIPIDALEVHLRLVASNNMVRGFFRPAGSNAWREAGACDLPVRGEPHVALQCYQGPVDVERWARLKDFQLTTSPAQSPPNP
jgi:regulation of enolase protein 1 (concanavalin A-like superfamily)